MTSLSTQDPHCTAANSCDETLMFIHYCLIWYNVNCDSSNYTGRTKTIRIRCFRCRALLGGLMDCRIFCLYSEKADSHDPIQRCTNPIGRAVIISESRLVQDK